jgi:multidrug efflux pump subunit AcrB
MRASAALILRDMRILFTVASLLVVVVVLGLIAKTQVQSLPKADAPASGAAASSTVEPAAAAQQIQRRIKDDVEKSMQAQPSRAEPAP